MRKRTGASWLVPFLGSYAVTVPGTVDGWFTLHEQFGKLPMHELLAPAINYAREGFPVSPVIALQWVSDMASLMSAGDLIEEFDNAHHTYLVNGNTSVVGQIFKNTDFAARLDMIAKDSRDAFYKGEIAHVIDAYTKRIHGDLSLEDLADHRGEWVRPGHVNYRGYDVYELPPNGQGFAALEMLGMLTNVELSRWDRGDSQLLHFLIEAKRLAFEDLAKFYGHPAFYDPPIKDYCRTLMAASESRSSSPKTRCKDRRSVNPRSRARAIRPISRSPTRPA